MKLTKLLFIFLLVLIGCKPSMQTINTKTVSILYPKKTEIDLDIKNWQHKDIFMDTIPGISLDKVYQKLLTNNRGNEIIVAVMDTGTDIFHEDLKGKIWNNKSEIPNNQKDDDGNGYVDDINGWNFLGSSNGDNMVYANWEFVKIIKSYDSLVSNVNEPKNAALYLTYQKAKKAYKEAIASLEKDKKFIRTFIRNQSASNLYLENFLGKKEYTYEEISRIDPKGSEELKYHIANRRHALYYDMDDNWIKEYQSDNEIIEKYKLNIDYNIRNTIQDEAIVAYKNVYGNNNVVGDLTIESHGTNVSGIIAATRNNNIGIDGIVNNVKIMPIRVVPQGDEYDVDVANGIRYAVDNGAKIINMSFGKEFSINTELVTDAIKYAAKKNVLIVHAAGNESFNVDIVDYFPRDIQEHIEISDNFMSIGASTYHLDSNLSADFSNYGKQNVDIFAPGDDIYTTSPKNSYETNSGTSFSAPIISGIAALIWSHYPDFSASEIKGILMNSGIEYNINVKIKQEDGTKKLVSFSELSKSGKVVNAYNALLLAEQISKIKR